MGGVLQTTYQCECDLCISLICRFYEWQTTKPGSKQPFFIYFASNKPSTETQQLTCGGAVKQEDGGVPPNEGRMLTMAGLFDIWRPPPEVHALCSLEVTAILEPSQQVCRPISVRGQGDDIDVCVATFFSLTEPLLAFPCLHRAAWTPCSHSLSSQWTQLQSLLASMTECL